MIIIDVEVGVDVDAHADASRVGGNRREK